MKHRLDGFMLRDYSLLSLMLAGLLTAHAVDADPRPSPAVACNAGGMTAHPIFDQVSPGRAEYSFSGVCTTREGLYLGYRLAATWTPTEPYPNANASETYRITTLSGPSKSFDVVFGAHCRADPWLNDAPCKRIGNNLSDELRALWPELGEALFPYSRNQVPRDQRAALRAEYDRANDKFDRSRLLHDGVRSADDRHGGAAMKAGSKASGTIRAVHDDVALNPQPLPPGPPDPDPMPSAPAPAPAAGKGSKAGIIIVGGKSSYRRIDQATTPARQRNATTP